MRVFLGFILITNLLCFGLTSCSGARCFVDYNAPTVDGIKLKYSNEIDLQQVYELSYLELSSGTGSTNLHGVEDNVIDISVQYYEYSPGDASLYIEDGLLVASSISGKPVSISKVIGKVPQTTNLRINAGTGNIVVADMDRCSEISVDAGTGNIDISRSNVGKLRLSSGTGSITLSHVIVDSGIVSTGTGNILVNNSLITRKDFSVGTGRIIENDEQEK